MLGLNVLRTLLVISVVGIFIFSVGKPVFSKEIEDYIEQPAVVGKARMSVMFWDIYDASLIAAQGRFEKGKPFVLSLTYLRDFDGEKIASRSVDEIRKLGMKDEMKLAKWYQEMLEIFPNVKKGETITGVVDDKQFSHFYIDKQLLGHVKDEEFSQWFFSIWLHENTSEPEMRLQLLGLDNKE